MSTPEAFVTLPMTVTAADLADIAIAYLQTQWPGWMPNDADLEVVQIEALALLAENACQIAAEMPPAALIAFGTKLLNQPYGAGNPATTTVTFTVADNAGYTIPGGVQVDIDGYAFQTTADLVIPAGQTTGQEVVSSTILTASANGLGAAITPISTPAWVTNLAITGGLTVGGDDPQSDQDYLNQISRDRQLTSKALVSLIDYEYMALDQPNIGRAKAEYGASVRNINVTVTNDAGQPAATGDKNALLALYQNPMNRMVNAIPTVVDATYTTINVVYTIYTNAQVDPTTVISDANAAIANELSPLGWGVPSSGDPSSMVTTWLNETTVHFNRIIAVIGKVPGVNYVNTLTLNGGTADIVMTGTVALPELGTISGTVSGSVD
jgi:uncharacterized phage protein gp47/JayE